MNADETRIRPDELAYEKQQDPGAHLFTASVSEAHATFCARASRGNLLIKVLRWPKPGLRAKRKACYAQFALAPVKVGRPSSIA